MHDSVSTAFLNAKRAIPGDALWIEQTSPFFHHDWTLYQYGVPVATLRGKETIVGGEHFSVIPILPTSWGESCHHYTLSPYNVPYWGGEVRIKRLDTLLLLLAQGKPIPEALDHAVDVDMDEDGEPYPDPGISRGDEGALYEPTRHPATTPTLGELLRAALRRSALEAEAHAHCEPEPEAETDQQEYLWTIWFEGRGGVQKADLTCTRELAGKVWDTLSHAVPRMLSARP